MPSRTHCGVAKKYKKYPHMRLNGQDVRMLSRREIREWAVRLRQIMSNEPAKKPVHFDEWGKV